MKTFTAKKENVQRNWYLLDAKNQVLGRLATRAAIILCGKHRADYTTHIDMGDFVVIINAKHVKLTGRKKEQKEYFRHSGYPGGLKKISYKELAIKKPNQPLKMAIFGMIANNHLKAARIRRLKVYGGSQHRVKQNLIEIKL